MTTHAIEPCFCFTGQAVEALNFYATTFDDATTQDMTYYGDDDPHGGEPGTLLFGTLIIDDRVLHFMDMPRSSPAPKPNWSASYMFYMTSKEQFQRYFDALKQDGQVMMGPEPVPGYELCTWVTDRFGITWQLLLEE